MSLASEPFALVDPRSGAVTAHKDYSARSKAVRHGELCRMYFLMSAPLSARLTGSGEAFLLWLLGGCRKRAQRGEGLAGGTPPKKGFRSNFPKTVKLSTGVLLYKLFLVYSFLFIGALQPTCTKGCRV